MDNFLESFVGYAWGMESGLPHRADFDRGSYGAVAKLIEPDFTVSNLARCFLPGQVVAGIGERLIHSLLCIYV